jgi:hypothetical protein
MGIVAPVRILDNSLNTAVSEMPLPTKHARCKCPEVNEQGNPGGHLLYNSDGGKGLELMPAKPIVLFIRNTRLQY